MPNIAIAMSSTEKLSELKCPSVKKATSATFIEDAANKMSYVKLEARKKKYSTGIGKNRKVAKSERSSCGIDVSAEIYGGLKIKDSQKKYNKGIEAEISCRRIELPEDDGRKKKTYD